MTCLCGNKAITHDGLCKECFFIREEIRYELKWKEKYDGRFKKKVGGGKAK
jgi:hypothetical protein